MDEKDSQFLEPDEISYDTEKPKLEPVEKDDLDDDDRIDLWLSDLEPGNSLVIKRIEPDYARGWLEEIPIHHGSAPIDIEQIRNRWGGYKLSLRVRSVNGQLGRSHIIEMFSFEPMRYGNPIKNQKNPHIGGDESMQPIIPQSISSQPPGADKDIVGQILASQQALLMNMLEQNQSSSKAPPAPAFSALGDALKIVQAIQGMGQASQAQVPAPIAGDEMGGLGAMMPLLMNLLQKPDKPKLTPPTPRTPNQDQSFEQQLLSMASKGPGIAANICAQVLASVPPGEREEAIDCFLKAAKIDLEEDNDLEDQYEDDETSG